MTVERAIEIVSFIIGALIGLIMMGSFTLASIHVKLNRIERLIKDIDADKLQNT